MKSKKALDADLNKVVSPLDIKTEDLTLKPGVILSDVDLSLLTDNFIWHGRTILCQGHCDDSCPEDLSICLICLHVECHRCLRDYNELERTEKSPIWPDEIYQCRICKSWNSFTDFYRTKIIGINLAQEFSFEKAGLAIVSSYNEIQEPLSEIEVIELVPFWCKIIPLLISPRYESLESC